MLRVARLDYAARIAGSVWAPPQAFFFVTLKAPRMNGWMRQKYA